MRRFFVLMLLTLIVFTSCSPTGDKVVAVVGNKKISDTELYRYVPKDHFEYLSSEERQQQIEQACNDFLAYSYLEDNDVFSREDVSWEIRVWEFKELANGAFQNLIINKIIPEAVLRQEYEKMKYELNVSHVLISYDSAPQSLNDRSKEDALKLVNDLVKDITPENFNDIVLEYSDDASKSDNGGNIGWGKSGHWVEAFENAAYGLKPGEISDPVETNFGYHIIKLNERREVPVDPYDELKPEIMDNLFNRWRKKFIVREDFVYDSLKSVYNLEYNDSALADFSERFVRLSKNVFYSDQFTAFDILDVFEDTLQIATLGPIAVDKAWLYKFLKLDNLQMPMRFDSEESVRGFIERNMMGEWLYHAALGLGLDKSKFYLESRDVYLAKKSTPLFEKLYVYEKINPSKEDLYNFYEENKNNIYQIEPRVKVREVLLEDSLKAADILKRAKAGESMAQLAEEFSIRNYGKKNKGLIPAVKKDQYGEMSLAAFNMRDGEIGGPYKIGKHYSVIQRIEYVPEKTRAYNDISYRVLVDYRNKYMPEKKAEQLKMLYKKYPVRINKSFIK